MNLSFESVGVGLGRRTDVPGKQIATIGIGVEDATLTQGMYLSRLDIEVLVDRDPNATVLSLEEQARAGAILVLRTALESLEGHSIAELRVMERERDVARDEKQTAKLSAAFSKIGSSSSD